MPVLDLGCGSGRNALALAELGLDVVCVDRDHDSLERLAALAKGQELNHRIAIIRISLADEIWPFDQNVFGTIVCIHYLDLALIPAMSGSLAVNGHLFIETIGGQGQNHLELPARGTLRRELETCFRFEFYKERPVGPVASGKAAVRLLAKKCADSAAQPKRGL